MSSAQPAESSLAPPVAPDPEPRARTLLRRSNRTLHVENRYIEGKSNHIDGNNNIVVGPDNTVTGDHLEIYGNGNRVTGDHLHVVGCRNIVRGQFVHLIGDFNTLTGKDGVVQGLGNRISGPEISVTAAAVDLGRYQPPPKPLVIVVPPSAPQRAPSPVLTTFSNVDQEPDDDFVVSDEEELAEIIDLLETDDEEAKMPAPAKRKHVDPDSVLATEFDQDEDDEREGFACNICMVKRKQLASRQCGHICCCFACARRLIETQKEKPCCPICKVPITEKMLRVRFL